MNQYEQACEWHASAFALIDKGFYQQSIYHFCLAGELYLKSALNLVSYEIELETSHDIIRIYRTLADRFGLTEEMTEATKYMRKYHNESRYPSYSIEFSKQTALDFKRFADTIKAYTDSCTGTPEDLASHFNKRL